MLNVNLQNHRDAINQRKIEVISSFMITSVAMVGLFFTFSDQPKNDF